MKFLHYGKDGGPKSTVHGFWFVEIKQLFSIALLRFSDGSRDSFHNHAFDSYSWVLTGQLQEQNQQGKNKNYRPSLRPIPTYRSTFHRVVSKGVSWVFTVRGPWSKTWMEYHPSSKAFSTLSNGRKIVAES